MTKAKNIRGFNLEYLYIIIIVLFPLWNISRGYELADVTCSLANYAHIDHLDSFWMYGYYLANLTGRFLSMLPLGDTMLGMNVYTSLVLSGIAVLAYCFWRNKVQREIAFLGVLIAIGLSWCPKVILYNYLTYFVFNLGAICLYTAICTGKEKWYVIAGTLLGINVFIRFPNVLQAALIVVVIFDAVFYSKNLLRKFLLCVGGYLSGILVCILAIALTGELGSFGDMIASVFTISGNSEGYSLFDMVTAMLGGYILSYKYMLVLSVIVFGGIFAARWFAGKIYYSLYTLFTVLIFVWFYRRGLWCFDYSSYGAFYKLAPIFLVIAILCMLAVIFSKKDGREKKILAVIVLVMIIITPFGSNNGLFPIYNNLFLIAPFTIYIAYEKTKEYFSAQIVLSVFLIIFLVQSIGFGMGFVFRAQTMSHNLQTKITGVGHLEGIRTTNKDANDIMSLSDYLEENGLIGSRAIVYGQVPGLYYIFDFEPVTTALWPDLVTNSTQVFAEDLQNVEGTPLVVVGAATDLANPIDEKEQLLCDYVIEHEYKITYKNERFVVYAATGNH